VAGSVLLSQKKLHAFEGTSSEKSTIRLSSLALMHIHYSVPVDMDQVIDRFKLLCHRRIALYPSFIFIINSVLIMAMSTSLLSQMGVVR
jgi:hypothetical protein